MDDSGIKKYDRREARALAERHFAELARMANAGRKTDKLVLENSAEIAEYISDVEPSIAESFVEMYGDEMAISTKQHIHANKQNETSYDKAFGFVHGSISGCLSWVISGLLFIAGMVTAGLVVRWIYQTYYSR